MLRLPRPARLVGLRAVARPRPRVLFLTCHLPWPPVSGGRRRELELIKRISERFDIHLLVVSKTCEQDTAHVAAMRRYCRRVEVLSATPPATAADDAQPPAIRRHRCDAASKRVSEILAAGAADLVHIEGFYLFQHVPEWCPLPTFLVEQNVEYELERQRAEALADPDALASFMRTRAAERACWRRATALAAVTADDAAVMRASVRDSDVRVVPDGANHVPDLRTVGPQPAASKPQTPVVALVANFAYAPNVDAAGHFCNEIFPLVRAVVADVRLWLVGNAPPAAVQALEGDDVIVTGPVPSVLPYLDAADVVVCPLRIGGGIKVKTIEALRRGKALVTTSVGAQGLPQGARAAMVIEDEPRAFASQVAALLGDDVRRRSLERAAARAGAALPTWDEAANMLGDAYDDLLLGASAANGNFTTPTRQMAGAAQ